MSRTDKDVPNWVTAEFWRPNHHFRCQAGRPAGRPCTLPDNPVRQHPVRISWRGRGSGCYWWPELRYKGYTPSSQDRRWYWWGPDRARVRDACHKAMQEYNGSGESEAEVPQWNHRHNPLHGGWWD